MPDESLPGFTVREAAGELGIHVQTLRARLREAEEVGQALGAKIEGQHGPEWRMCPAVLWAERYESIREATDRGDLTQTDSGAGRLELQRLEALLAGIRGGIKALQPSEAERRAVAEREARIVAALECAPEARALAEELGRAQAERDRLRAERDRLRDELQEARRAPWWRRMIGR